MDLVTYDFETYYDSEYSLSKMTTEAYVRDPRFETIMLSIRINEAEPYWVPQPDVKPALRDLRPERRAALCHHSHFDGLVLSHHYGVYPKVWFDTLSMARNLHGANGGLSLAKLAERYGVGRKGDEVVQAKGLHFKDFTPEHLARYGLYCCLDNYLTYELFMRMLGALSREELQIIDQVIRMFTEPVLELDEVMLADYAAQLRAEKTVLMLQAGAQAEDLMSNDKFADMLRNLGVEPPTKTSPTWLKKAVAERDPVPPQIYAFAKTDVGMQTLQEHPDERVQILVEARLKNKTTIAEKGAERLIGMSRRGAATVYYKYSGAASHRFSGGDKFNWQSMKRGSSLRKAVTAPVNHVVVVGDSSNIEARLLDWLAGQEDMVQVYRDFDAGTGPDMYCVMAGRIYNREINKARDPDERQMGKKAKLGLGYGMGAPRFVITMRGEAKDKDGRPLILPASFGQHVVDIYRSSHPFVIKLWKRGEGALAAIAERKYDVGVDFRGLVRTCEDGLVFPGGLKILYPDLRRVKDAELNSWEWEFWNGKQRERIYGAKVIENIIQCLARIVVMKQCLDTARECAAEEVKWKISSHDEGGFVTHVYYAPYVLERLMAQMRTPPSWAPDLPLNSEGGFHQRYGLAKK